MKKISLLALFGVASMAVSVQAERRDSDIYIINKTGQPITVTQPLQREHLALSNKTMEQPVGSPQTIKSGKRVKIASIHRDQVLGTYKQSDVTFSAGGYKFDFQSSAKVLASASTLTLNGKRLPYVEPGLSVKPKMKTLPDLFSYQDVEIIFGSDTK